MTHVEKLQQIQEMKDELPKTLKTYEKLLKATTSNENPHNKLQKTVKTFEITVEPGP